MPTETPLYQSGQSLVMGNNVVSMVRPPRAPTTPSLNSNTFQKKSSFQPVRSSPQPRASVSGDTPGPTTTRNMSHSRPSQSHFLQGINVEDDCFDVRSIPDPPSPVAPSRSNRRRLSTPMMMSALSSSTPGSRGLDDVTNNRTPCDQTQTKNNGSNRKRKSLIHVQAPEPVREDKLGCTSTDSRCSHTEAYSPRTLQVNICLEEEELEQAKISPKRRKKRQSIVVPTPLVFSEKGNSKPSPSRVSTQPMQRSPSLSPVRKSFPGTWESMEQLRALVRGYCAMSDAEKSFSDSADQIRMLTGYPMPAEAQTKTLTEQEVETDQKVIMANRRRVFSKISPAMAEMEKQKEHDTKQWERDTGYRVGKSNKSGKYRYFSIEDKQRVASQEYKRRYMAVLECSRPIRAAAAEMWMEKLASTKTVFNDSKAPMEESSFALCPVVQKLPNVRAVSHEVEPEDDPSKSNTTTQQNEVQQREAFIPPEVRPEDDPSKSNTTTQQIEAQQRQAFIPPKSNLGGRKSPGSDDTVALCHLGGSDEDDTNMDLVENSHSHTPMQLVAEISEASSEDTEEYGSRSDTPSPLPLGFVAPGHADEMNMIGPFFVAQSSDELHLHDARNKSPEIHDNAPLLPLPSRQAESLDPDIAQAEKRLWDKIDAALKEYSEEVMIIRKSKNDGFGGM
ncbi:hypothetical protein IV203_037603 [Nitzschia inconspicua]|uniref:Uncharacterized protein n=1 Tax=Nitzschia inconspicua TaxID=303405 RepID=A0A9K3LP96_9STRA|nr:hypothetical protein IV203_037603 [Nitzschia inconspicua]